MKSNAKSKILILITLGLLFVLIPIIFPNLSHFTDNISRSSDYNDNSNLDKRNLKISAVSGPIHIINDSGWVAFRNDGNCTGSGTYSDPYVIEDLVIDAGVSGSCIWIENSNIYFKIENCTLYNSGNYPHAGIRLSNVSNSQLIDNNCSSNFLGIRLEYSNSNSISGNTANDNNNYYGIYLYGSDNNNISGNTANNNDWHGIYLYSSDNNNISGNTANNNDGHGIYLDVSQKNNISGNTVSNNAVHGISLFGGYSNNISGNTANNNNDGINLQSGFDNEISGNTANNNGVGICLNNSDGNTISGNTANNNDWHGISLFGGHSNNISKNTANNNSLGIYLGYCDNNEISGNTANNNSITGYLIYYSDYNIVAGNNVTNNNQYGVWVREGSEDNFIFNNTFIGNLVNAFDNGTGNQWDDGSLGNYWDDYGGDDVNDDGIGDTPYTISGTAGSQDNFPIWDDGDDAALPIIKIISPQTDQVFGTNAPNFQIEMKTLYTNSTWYTIDGGTTNYAFSGLFGTVNQSAWNDKGTEMVTLSFYANNSVGQIGSKSVIIWKDVAKPDITINSPTSNKLCGIIAPTFSLTINEPNLHKKWYSLNGGQNITFTTENQFSQAEWDKSGNGTVLIRFYANDTVGNMNYSEVLVRKDAYEPVITIYSPIADQKFGISPPTFNISIDEETSVFCWYTIEGVAGQFLFTELSGIINQSGWDDASEGQIMITFYARDEAGNVGSNFVLVIKEFPEELPEEPIPLELIITISSISGGAVIGVATFLLIRRKRKRIT